MNKVKNNSTPLRYSWDSPEIKISLEIAADYSMLSAIKAQELLDAVTECLTKVSDLPGHYYKYDS